MATEKVEPQTRVEEIEELLNAYRNGWICYDKAHVSELQAERQRLKTIERAQEA